MADQFAIYDATLACYQVFRGSVTVPILEEWAENCLADLNLWAYGAGAVKVGEASLDARLSSNLDAKVFVVNILRMLRGFVEKCVEIGSEMRKDTPETSELSQAIQDVKYIIGQLSRITIAIRKTGTNAGIQKADASYDPAHPQIEALSQHLQLILLAKPNKNGTLQAEASSQGMRLFSCIDNTTVINSQSLTTIQQRLIESNLKRRNRFLYAQRHAMKLSERNQVPSVSLPTPRKPPMPSVLDVFERTTEEHEMPKVYSTTTATEVQEPTPLPAQASAQPATTAISAISSRVTYPRPPPLKSDQNVFQCPCCCQTLSTSVSRGSRWKKHLSQDILPYTCILEDCPHPEKLYHTKDLWLSHMLTDHGGISHWICLACNDSNEHPVFYEESAFIEHLEERHSRGIEPQHIPMLATAWKRNTLVSIRSCPLCGFEDQDLEAVLNHAAEHLHSFSLRSLPWAPGGDESDDVLYNGYYEEHPYFSTGQSVDIESELSRSTMSPEQRDLEDLPAIGSGEETTENNLLTEEKIRGLVINPNVAKGMLDAFLNGVENQESFPEPSPLASVSNLASVLDSQSQYKEAEAVHRRGLEVSEKLLGPEQPDALTTMASLASKIGNQGQWKDAEDLEVQVLKGRERKLGPVYPDTLTDIGNLAVVYHAKGHYKKAEELEIRVLESRKRILGPEHPDTLIAMGNLSVTYRDQGQWKKAEDLRIQVLETQKQVLGPEHPHTLTSMHNVAIIWVSQGKLRDGLALMEKCVQLRNKVLHPNHPDAKSSSQFLGEWKDIDDKQRSSSLTSRKSYGIFARTRDRKTGYGE
ncbi:hypothetical protein BDV39DRAFT_211546 [Aspergillus sergii]|uniref:C2H2-type domain-containing protein n=1 Tax=Aspergillus sergii TaxID=1034303 RepID=A0A5N6WIS7_9EURO|nr:hypothetical protein BDV39DRAFT_211546 [Aspergillus sergii]